MASSLLELSAVLSYMLIAALTMVVLLICFDVDDFIPALALGLFWPVTISAIMVVTFCVWIVRKTKYREREK